MVVALLIFWTFVLGRTPLRPARLRRRRQHRGGAPRRHQRRPASGSRSSSSARRMAAISGIVAASYAGKVSPGSGGGNTLLYAVGAAVIGGTSLFGGKGRDPRRRHRWSGDRRSSPTVSACSTRRRTSTTSSPARVLLLAASVDALAPTPAGRDRSLSRTRAASRRCAVTTRRTTVAVRTRRFRPRRPPRHAPPSIQRVAAGSVPGGSRGERIRDGACPWRRRTVAGGRAGRRSPGWRRSCCASMPCSARRWRRTGARRTTCAGPTCPGRRPANSRMSRGSRPASPARRPGRAADRIPVLRTVRAVRVCRR